MTVICSHCFDNLVSRKCGCLNPTDITSHTVFRYVVLFGLVDGTNILEEDREDRRQQVSAEQFQKFVIAVLP
jgi:hypothetical protein